MGHVGFVFTTFSLAQDLTGCAVQYGSKFKSAELRIQFLSIAASFQVLSSHT